MKNVTFLLLLISFLLTPNVKAQLPDIPNVDYSSRTGTFEDTRDGKTYAYKKYGKYDWFMQNLNWDGAGLTSESDPDGTKYGRYYNVSESNQSLCPKGWTLAKKEIGLHYLIRLTRSTKLPDLSLKIRTIGLYLKPDYI